jgi:hypothetical protein
MGREYGPTPAASRASSAPSAFNYANYLRPDAPYQFYEMWLGESPSNSAYWNEAADGDPVGRLDPDGLYSINWLENKYCQDWANKQACGH